VVASTLTSCRSAEHWSPATKVARFPVVGGRLVGVRPTTSGTGPRDNGPTCPANLVLLCARDHRVIHHEGWTMRIGDHGLPVFRPPRWIDPDQTGQPAWNASWQPALDQIPFAPEAVSRARSASTRSGSTVRDAGMYRNT
jgi:hypothetical protein